MPKVIDKIKSFCSELGKEYFVTIIDGEDVISRDFGNGFDVEISGFYSLFKKHTLTIYLWKDKTRLLQTVENVSLGNVGDKVEELYRLTLSKTDWEE